MGLIEYVGSIGGIAGVLCLLIFCVYRSTVNLMREDRKYMEDRLTMVINCYNIASIENTKVLTELITYLRQKNGNPK